MIPPREAEVLVVGGGPAGAMAAAALAAGGRRPVLVEASRGPRDRVCGEFLSPEALPLLERLGLREELLRAAPPPALRARFTAPGGRELEVDLAPAGPGLGISRRLLDGRLLDRARDAGARVVRGARLLEIRRDAGGRPRTARIGTPSGDREIAFGFLIGADGRGSAVARWLGLERPPVRPGRCALKAHFRPGPGMRGLSGAVEVHIFPGGYVGLQEVEGNRVNVSAVVEAPLARRLGGGALGVLLGAARRSPRAAARLDGAAPAGPAVALYPLERRRRAACGAGFLLAGDAAGAVPPFAGEGISMALRSGLLGAEAAGRALAGRPSGYRRSRRRDLEPARLVSRLLDPLLHRPRLAGPAMGLLAGVPGLTAALLRATRAG